MFKLLGPFGMLDLENISDGFKQSTERLTSLLPKSPYMTEEGNSRS